MNLQQTPETLMDEFEADLVTEGWRDDPDRAIKREKGVSLPN